MECLKNFEEVAVSHLKECCSCELNLVFPMNWKLGEEVVEVGRRDAELEKVVGIIWETLLSAEAQGHQAISFQALSSFFCSFYVIVVFAMLFLFQSSGGSPTARNLPKHRSTTFLLSDFLFF